MNIDCIRFICGAVPRPFSSRANDGIATPLVPVAFHGFGAPASGQRTWLCDAFGATVIAIGFAVVAGAVVTAVGQAAPRGAGAISGEGFDMRRRVVAVPVAAVAAAIVVAGAVVLTTPAHAEERAAVPGTHPAWAQPSNEVADADADEQMTFRVYLKMRDLAGAQATARAVSTPDSGSYQRFLTPEQVRSRYSPNTSDIKEVSSWLRESGFRVGTVPSNNLYVEATGNVAQAKRAFGTDLNLYRVADQVVRGSEGELTMPASVASVVSGVVGVDTALSLLRPDSPETPPQVPAEPSSAGTSPGAPARTASGVSPAAAPTKGFRNAEPCSKYWGEKIDTTNPAYGEGYPSPLPYAPCGYTPPQLRAAYGLAPSVDYAGRDGRGVTVAIVAAFASPTLYQDAAEYARRNDPQHPLRPGQFSQIVFPPTVELESAAACNAESWYTEQTLDVEAVHAMAPGANILYVGASDCRNPSLDKALNEVVAGGRAQIISNSYGALESSVSDATVRAFESIVLQAVMQGIGVYYSSGDDGDNSGSTGTVTASFPASLPWVTTVGGTSLGIAADGQIAVETGWQTTRSVLTSGAWKPAAPGTYQYGSGGGTSRLFTQPAYQSGVVPDALARANQTGQTRGRVVPDLSMVGDPNTGMLLGQTQTLADGVYYNEVRSGGTSLSTPLLAGYMAVSDQIRGRRHGFINPSLYSVSVRYSSVRDVQHVPGGVVRVDYRNGFDSSGGLSTSIRTFDYQGLTIRTTPLYDAVTGLGTPNGGVLLYLQ